MSPYATLFEKSRTDGVVEADFTHAETVSCETDASAASGFLSRVPSLKRVPCAVFALKNALPRWAARAVESV